MSAIETATDAGRGGPVLKTLECICAMCGAAKVTIPNVAVRGASEGEIYDEAVTPLRALGWGLRRVPHPDGELCPACGRVREVRQILCPACLSAHLAAVAFSPRRLPAHSIKARCPKCGAADARVQYCDGRSPAIDLVPVEHLRRTCKRCGYAWPERCADIGATVCLPSSGITNLPRK